MFPAGNDVGAAYARWQAILTQAGHDHDTIPAGELYTGQHWRRAAATAARTGSELWVLSAGLGLLHVTDRVMPYEATFSEMPFSHQALWAMLTANPPTPRRCASLQALMQARPDDRFVIAASPVYLRAVEADVCAGRAALTSSSQLTIVTSRGYQGRLLPDVRLASAEMMNALRTNMTGLNVSYALRMLEDAA